MTLRDIIKDCGVIDVKGNLDIRITAVTDDSRKVSEGALFVAVKGHGADGHAFIAKAIEAGAAAIVYEEDSSVASRLQNDNGLSFHPMFFSISYQAYFENCYQVFLFL